MKYESDILKRLIDTYGVVGNPQYISEIIKEFIVRGKECFPNLFTYQSDWLAHIDEFGLKPSYTVSYTGQSIYAPNTLEKPVKSAILTGQTLVNLSPFTNKIDLTSSSKTDTKKPLQPLIQNKKYILIFNVTNSSSSSVFDYIMVRGYNTDGSFKEYGRASKIFENGREYIMIQSTDGDAQSIFIGANFSCEIDGAVLIDYQDGMENWDIPYFTGMQSVKMPVLKTTGKNLFDEKLENNRDIDVNTGVVLNGGRTIPRNFIPVEPNTSYTLTRPVATDNIGIRYYSKSQDYLSSQTFPGYTGKFSATFSTPSNCYFIKFIDEANTLEKGYQIEQCPTATSYEPFKSNILTVNEDVTLRSNGDICDELNLLTGQLTQRIGEDGVVLSQEIVKTVDLSILDQNGQNVKQLMAFNGGTHFNTGSSVGSPLPTVSVSVETDLEETIKVCSLEGNTL